MLGGRSTVRMLAVIAVIFRRNVGCNHLALGRRESIRRTQQYFDKLA